MISLLKNNLLISPFFLAALAFIMRIAGILNPNPYLVTDNDSILFSFIINAIPSPMAQSIVSTLFVVIQALLINRIVINFRLMDSPNYLAAFVYLLLVSMIPDFLSLHPFIVANTFFIIAVGFIANTYKKPKASLSIFNIGFLISISSLIYFPFLVFYAFASLSLMVIRSYNLVERLQLFCGFLTPYYLLSIYFYWNDGLSSFFSDYIVGNVRYPSGLFSLDKMYIITLSTALLLVVFSLFSYGSMIRKKGIQIEKVTDVIYWIFIFAFFGVFFWNNLSIYHFLFLAFPASIILSNNIFLLKNTAIAEILGLSLVFIIFAIHFILF